MTTDPIERAQAFRDLHRAPGCFVMPNAWDAGSARLLAAAGFAALGTTSAGIAFSRGLPDYEDRVSRAVMLEACAAIAAAVDVPVSGDLEAGYGATPGQVAETMGLAIEAGLAGGSLEDHLVGGANELYDMEQAAERVAAAREAIDASGMAFVLTARAECYLTGHPEPFAESVRRLNRYRDAGADCLYAPGLRTAEEIGRLVREVDGPVNVVMGLAGAALTVNELAALGVKRISCGGSLARAASRWSRPRPRRWPGPAPSHFRRARSPTRSSQPSWRVRKAGKGEANASRPVAHAGPRPIGPRPPVRGMPRPFGRAPKGSLLPVADKQILRTLARSVEDAADWHRSERVHGDDRRPRRRA